MKLEDQSTIVLCKDCRHSFRSVMDIIFMPFNQYAYKCRKYYTEKVPTANFVTGGPPPEREYHTCARCRNNQLMCTADGVSWEPKNTKKHFFTIIKHQESLHGQK